MKKVTRLPLTLALVALPTFIQMKVALALLAALTLSISLITGAGAQDSPEATITIDSVSLVGRTIVVTGTVTCAEAEAGELDMYVSQREASELYNYLVRCSPGEGTPYEARVSASTDPGFAGEFGGGQVVVGVSFRSDCQLPEGGPCSYAAAEGTFTVEGPPPGESPEEMPKTGAGGLASGATIPVANAAAGLLMLVGVGTVVLRRR